MTVTAARPATAVEPRRSGAVLLLALLVVLLLDCVVLGTVHLAILERRLADNARTALRMRLAAEAAVRSASQEWTTDADSLSVGAPPLQLLSALAPDGDTVTAAVQRVAATYYLIRGEARHAAGGYARAAASLLVRPPALPPGVDFTAAALSASGNVHIAEAGALLAALPPECAAGSAVRMSGADRLLVDATATLEGAVQPLLPENDLTAHFDRLLQLMPVPAPAELHLLPGETRLQRSLSGVVIVDGSLTVAGGVGVTGLVIVRGSLLMEDGARVDGVVHVDGDVELRGAVTADICAARDAVRAAGIDRPVTHPHRAWLPAW